MDHIMKAMDKRPTRMPTACPAPTETMIATLDTPSPCFATSFG